MSRDREKEALSNYKKAKGKRQEKDDLWYQLDAFDRGEQWQIESKGLPPWVPKPVTNFIHLVKTTKRAAIAMENPTGKLRAVSPLDSDPIAKLQKAYEFTWQKIKARKIIRENIETAKLLGTGITQVFWDENIIQGGTDGLAEGEIRLKQIEPSTFYPDPSAFTIEECKFIIIKERKHSEWLKKHPIFGKKFNPKTDDGEGSSSPTDRGEIYHRDYSTEQEGLVDFMHYYKKEQNSEGGYTYSVTYLANGKEVHHVSQLKPNMYPFAILYDFPQRHDFWGQSTCQLILDNQKIINKVESIIAMMGTILQNPQKIIDKSSGINPQEAAKYANAPGKVWVSNVEPSRAMHWQQPPQIPPTLFNLAEQAKQNIREITGMNEAYMGQSVGSLQTSSGVDSLIDRSTMRDRDQMYDVELYVEELSRLVIAFMVEYYDTPRYMRILDDQDQEQFEVFVGVDFKDLEYDFHIDVSAKAPITRMREQQEAKELLNMQGQYQYNPAIITPQEYMKIANFVHADKLIDRMNIEEMQNKVQEAMQVAQMMTEAMGQGVPPEEVMQMGQSMFTQMEENPQGMGSTSNSNNVQMRQGGV